MSAEPAPEAGGVPRLGIAPDVVPVLIAGAGPTGVTAATLLARHGVRSLVVDPHPGVYPMPRAVHLDDEVMRILQALGVAGEFAAISSPAPGMRLVDGDLRTIAEFRRDRAGSRHGWPQANMFDQPDLEALLRANLRRHPEAELRPGTEVVHISQDVRGPVRVLLRDVAGGRQEEVRAHALLGCDGANSITRRYVGARMRGPRFAEPWLVVDVRCAVPLDVWDGIHQVCDPERPATFMRIGPERYRWEFRMRTGESEAELTRRDTLLRLISPWTRGVPEGELRLLRQAAYTFRAQVADRWRRGRVFLLGDAAHLTPPFIGQGMGAGLRDAANLAWKLALVLSEGGDERLLDTYQAERAPHVTHVIRLAVAVGLAMAGGREPHATAAVRRLLLAQAARMPAIHRVTAHGTSPALHRGLLVRRRSPLPPGLPGSLVPQPWVEVGGEHRRLDDVLGDSFAVISLGPLDADLASLARRLRATVVHVRRPDRWPAPAGGQREQPACLPGHRSEPPGEHAAQHGRPVVVEDATLDRWLRDAGAAAVLVRPDRVVLAAAPFPRRPGPVGAAIVRDAAAWLPLLPPARTTRATRTADATPAGPCEPPHAASARSHPMTQVEDTTGAS
ncbi:bifunctional 3-(3-hydroxy-phenyl)propionate/3-hydroxycinnamic acid hydroxylase [Nonomuraea basaltis]|uniref:bifunctional 3-(3-hydroxy-phenyl)propionate/3-hydroxycinnamic acid hydroxylase MhpA n=1 Tax=Nonomuraea basaltis TaxID=2495887 RepID=UPI00110C3EE0|nr:bifunctional 3-(3-hydroxy-phenyl)propionate/3-hydroxycinnamic acid hydroxylase [Nonomuraea basaltis]TMR94486.1 bifunctional 3-(3-hydroxy-phenyl)propionate/3-hydroxycinnamic acid hydroxylase [Nonomuraea basaltis]